jgi:trypsin-like peptidase
MIMEAVVSIGYYDRDNYFVSGTGVIIAPHLAITAKHVIEDFLKQFTNANLERNMASGKNSETIENINILTSNYGEAGKKMNVWRVYEIYFCLQSDIAYLYMLPANEEAKDFKWNKCKLDLNPPLVGSLIFGFGFHNSTSQIGANGNTINLHWNNSGATTTGEVIEVFPARRDSSRLNFPCFQTDAQFDGGMSGGPIFNEGGCLCGLICNSMPATEEFPEHISYVALLWPEMITQLKIPYPELVNNIPYSVLKLAEMGAIVAIGWEKNILTNTIGGDWYDTIALINP